MTARASSWVRASSWGRQTERVNADGWDEWRITDGYHDVAGVWHETDPEARASLRKALGDPPADEEISTWFVRAGEQPEVWSPGLVELEDGAEVPVVERLPGDLPLGVHLLHSSGGHTTRLFVVPTRVRRLARSWGWALQTHSAVGEESWGIGDLSDVRRIGERSAACGAGVLASSPLGAPIPVPPIEPSPYSPSSRRHWNLLYLRVDEVRGAELAAEAVEVAATAGRGLAEDGRIHHDAVWQLKRQALQDIFDALGQPVRLEDLTRSSLDHATFDALAEHHGGGRNRFPTEHGHPDLPSVEAWRRQHAGEVAFWAWIQQELTDQLARAATGIDLIVDLPVGFHPDGADAWRDQDLLAVGCRIGAPPDEFNNEGQDWGLPPYVPWRLRADGYRTWIETLRSAFQHAAAIRIDHVVGLSRLYCVPPGLDARHGAYLRQYGLELLDVACLEAARVGAALIGEDLGTVEAAVRSGMSERSVPGYRIAWFETTPPESWPECSVGMLTTHDLPTIAGIWTGIDEVDRIAAGLKPAPEEADSLRQRLQSWIGTEEASLSDVIGAANRRLWESSADVVLFTPEDAVGDPHRPNLPGTQDENPNWRRALPDSSFARLPPLVTPASHFL